MGGKIPEKKYEPSTLHLLQSRKKTDNNSITRSARDDETHTPEINNFQQKKKSEVANQELRNNKKIHTSEADSRTTCEMFSLSWAAIPGLFNPRVNFLSVIVSTDTLLLRWFFNYHHFSD